MMRKSSALTVTDQFCGAGGSSLGATAAGAQVVLAMNHWKLAVETHNTNFPDTLHDCTDISACDPRRYPHTDILITSPECFPAGTIILAKRGLLPIEEIRVGDEVLTHENRWRPITTVMSHTASTLVLCGQGHGGLEVTTEHPFYVREQTQCWDNKKRNYNCRVYSEPTWIEAQLLTTRKYRWATPTSIAPLEVPPIPGRTMPFDDPEFWWFIGRWLGDGIVRLRPDQGGEITIVAGNHKADDLERHLAHWLPQGSNKRAGDNELRWRRREIRTATLFECGHQSLAQWIVEHFGKLAYGKTVPSWALSLPREHREALLEGYISADGYTNVRYTSVTTVSKRLALGIRLLAESLGYRASLSRHHQHANVIEGRHVQVRDCWFLRWENNASQRAAFDDGIHSWSLVKKIEPGREDVTVYNLSVAEDESYVADGIVVHNCTHHSQAGGKKRKHQAQPSLWEVPKIDPAAERSRATMLDVPRFAEYHRYECIIVENVVEAREWILFDEWLLMMQKLGYTWEIVYFNSMFAHPTPQSRDRMYVVFWKKGNTAPDLRFTPTAWCAKCGKDVASVQSWKNPLKRSGRYGKQYVYCCPACAGVVVPYYYAAMNAIHWHLPIQRISERKKPLKPKTLRRVQLGIDRFASSPVLIELAHGSATSGMVHSALAAYPTQTTAQSIGLASPFALSLDHLQATRDTSTVVPYLIDFTGQEPRARSVADPLATVVAGGNHHGLVVSPPVSSSFLISYYGQDAVRSTLDPLGTLTTMDRHALVTAEQPVVEDCYFRMLQPAEIGRAMAFPETYVVLGNNRQKTKLYGNAVTPPVMQMILERCVAPFR